MALAIIDSVATTKTLCSNLRELPTYCTTIKGDIELLQSHFDANYMQIIACGATVDNLVDILFSAYMVVLCHNFRGYIKHKQDAYTDGTLILNHDELIILVANKFNLLKQEEMWGATKTPDKDKIVAMQAKLTALKGQFQLAPDLKKAVRAKDDNKAGDKKQGEGNNKNRRTRRTMLTGESRRRMRIGRRLLQRRKKLVRRRSRDVHGIGATTTWHGATTRKQTADLARTTPTSRIAASTKSQPKPP
jgi:hypothetical protein